MVIMEGMTLLPGHIVALPLLLFQRQNGTF